LGDYRIYSVGVWSFVGRCERGVHVKVDYEVRGSPTGVSCCGKIVVVVGGGGGEGRMVVAGWRWVAPGSGAVKR
jgi:hypothetical protein